jgi:hypothetical protein
VSDLTLVCGHPRCTRPIAITEPHVRQSRIDADGVPRRGEWDNFHLPCHLDIGGKVDYVEPLSPTSHPDQVVIPLD